MTKDDPDLSRTSSFFRSALCMFIASIALLVNALDELGISNNTIVIFCADNGTHGPVTSIWGDGGPRSGERGYFRTF